MRRRAAVVAVALGTAFGIEALGAAPAYAQPPDDSPRDPAPASPPEGSAPQPPARRDGDKRAVPDYDGRAEPTTAGDVLLWVPRLLLSPAYLATEYVIRRPLGLLISHAERAGWPRVLYEFFTFGVNHEAGLFPIAFFDFGLEPSVGLYFFWDDAFTRGHDLRLRAATWGDEWIAGSVISRAHLGEDSSLTFSGLAMRRPDYLFHGEGARSVEANESRYGAMTFEGGLELEKGLWRTSRLNVAIGVRDRSFRRQRYDSDDADLEERVAAGDFPMPAAYEDGYTVLFNRVFLAIDSRRPHPEPGTGIRLELHATQLADAKGRPDNYIRYGAALGGFYDVDDRGRVISLYASTVFADPLSDAPVPFTELAQLGGTEPMRGFLEGRLFGRSAAQATLQYRWPIWVALDGSLQASVGNVFGAHLEDFEPELLRFSASLGIESTGSRDGAFELLFGLGSETFAQGGEITSFRLVFGTRHGF